MNLSRHLRTLALVAACSLSAAVHAAPIATLFSTGVDANGAPLALGAADAHYTVVETGLAARVHANTGSYFANDAQSQWIWENANGQPVNVTRTFRTTFDLTGLDHTSALVSGLWGTDNQGFIRLNGVNTGFALVGTNLANFQQLHAFNLTSGFVAGINTLDFVVEDNGGIGAFRAQITSGTADVATGVPAPAGGGLLIAAFAAWVVRRRVA